jgi:hypothetical protein
MGSGTAGGADVLGGDEISRSYEQYIEKVACDNLAREVKLADLADNLANNRRLGRRRGPGRMARPDSDPLSDIARQRARTPYTGRGDWTGTQRMPACPHFRWLWQAGRVPAIPNGFPA